MRTDILEFIAAKFNRDKLFVKLLVFIDSK